MKRLNCRRKPTIFIISGPSGSGKTTLVKRIIERSALKNILLKPVSFTTRLPRQGERKGVDYHFLCREEFNAHKDRGEFLESQEVFGNYYATSKKEIEKILKHHRDILLCVDIKGAQSVRRIFSKNTVLIFILPPEFRILHQRLQWRATEKREDLRLRLETAEEEIKHAELYDYVVINDKIPQAVRALEAIILAERSPVYKLTG
jgi:guanylate kinase